MSWQIENVSGAALITMNSNPLNLQNENFFLDLREAFDRLESEFAELPVVLTAEGTTFSAGLDFETVFPVFSSGDDGVVADWFGRYRATNLRLFQFPRPIVAAVNGHAFAGGLITAICCDYRFGVSEAKFSVNEVAVGIPMPSIYAEIIRYAIGSPATSEAVLFAEIFDAERALNIGFIHEIVAADELVERALARATLIKPYSFDAYAYSKLALQAPVMRRIEEISTRLDPEALAAVTSKSSVVAQGEAYDRLKSR